MCTHTPVVYTNTGTNVAGDSDDYDMEPGDEARRIAAEVAAMTGGVPEQVKYGWGDDVDEDKLFAGGNVGPGLPPNWEPCAAPTAYGLSTYISLHSNLRRGCNASGMG